MIEIKNRLKNLIKVRNAVQRGNFTLSSGKKSDLYINSKLVSLNPPCFSLIGEIGWELIKKICFDNSVFGIGGMTMGADPIALAISVASKNEQLLEVFSVRKESKGYGVNKDIEGYFLSNKNYVVVDDVVTTGKSTIKAIEKVKEKGGNVVSVLCLVDRQEGGKEEIEKYCKLISIFTRADFVSLI